MMSSKGKIPRLSLLIHHGTRTSSSANDRGAAGCAIHVSDSKPAVLYSCAVRHINQADTHNAVESGVGSWKRLVLYTPQAAGAAGSLEQHRQTTLLVQCCLVVRRRCWCVGADWQVPLV